jgi:hypothetical protein
LCSLYICVVRKEIGSRALAHCGLPFRASDGKEDPLDLSILLSGGKETNKDSPSNGE